MNKFHFMSLSTLLIVSLGCVSGCSHQEDAETLQAAPTPKSDVQMPKSTNLEGTSKKKPPMSRDPREQGADSQGLAQKSAP